VICCLQLLAGYWSPVTSSLLCEPSSLCVLCVNLLSPHPEGPTPEGVGYKRAGLKPAPTCSCHAELCLLHTCWGVSASQIYNIQFTIINIKSSLFKVTPATRGSPVVREMSRLRFFWFRTSHLPPSLLHTLNPKPFFCDRREPRLRRSGATFPAIRHPVSGSENSLRCSVFHK